MGPFNEEGVSPVHVVVVGGGTNPYWMAMDFGYVASASVDKWR
jgi:hypothetical protein